MKVAVTAASGQLGSAVIKKLTLEIGAGNIVGTARTASKAEHLGVAIKAGDYNSQSDFEEAFRGMEVAMIVSGMDAPEKRVEQHRKIIHAAKLSGVRKLVYSSIIGEEAASTFDPIVRSNRQTEKDIRDSGLEWCIGRNGLYIEPDVEYIEQYKKDGKIANCAGKGLCSYTIRSELAYAYTRMILDNHLNGNTFNLAGTPITQDQLAAYLNMAFGTGLEYEEMAPEDYLESQKKTNGEFLGTVIAGIYTKIRNGEFNVKSDFAFVADRDHVSWQEYFEGLKEGS
jgi:NAD(P)H dehydrogenase (quinone)